ncbi:hypothetical protein HPP92_009033 [Vanilla planifolia]|uniref:RRM domain-containing protein n=1 Tax=Vanilla planifolia TaxID=51239 RepID=A0A835V709_VANPL|nr:hypothetical protein HPP92_009033 [Vanilla planifolia]
MEASYWVRQTFLPSSNVSVPKRQRTEADAAIGALPVQEAQTIVTHDGHTRIQAQKDTRTLGATYDSYLQTAQPLSSYGSAQGGNASLPIPTGHDLQGSQGANAGLPYHDSVVFGGRAYGSSWPSDVEPESGMSMAYRSQTLPDTRVLPALPTDASSTLYVEGLPRDATEREVAHIFRPFLGFEEVRLVKKEPKYDSGSPVLLCFVDFTTPAYAMAAMNAVEGYSMDLHDPYSSVLRLQFAKFPARRPSRGFRGRRERH